MKRIALIVNPYASGVDEESTEAVRDVLRRVAEVTTMRTERPGHAIELASVLRGDLDAVVVFSGDGGFNEVMNGLRDPVPIGFIPGGGASVLPRALGLSRDPVEAAQELTAALEAGLVRRVDERGRDAEAGRANNLWLALAAGRLLYERRGRLEPVLEVEGHGRAAFALVANADPYSYAGPLPLRVAPEASFEL